MLAVLKNQKQQLNVLKKVKTEDLEIYKPVKSEFKIFVYSRIEKKDKSDDIVLKNTLT
jgi:hypothetical protein